jgi:cold shock CspA family protein
MKIVGKILWWDNKDQNGVIVDAGGNEYYFDISVVAGKRLTQIKTGAVVQFQINEKIQSISCARAVVLPATKTRGKLEREFEKNLQLSFAV